MANPIDRGPGIRSPHAQVDHDSEPTAPAQTDAPGPDAAVKPANDASQFKSTTPKSALQWLRDVASQGLKSANKNLQIPAQGQTSPSHFGRNRRCRTRSYLRYSGTASRAGVLADRYFQSKTC